jgi:hypothetical protein
MTDVRIDMAATSFEVNIVPVLEPPYDLALKAQNKSAQGKASLRATPWVFRHLPFFALKGQHNR